MFSFANGAHEILLLSFVLSSFQVLGKDLMDYGTRNGKSLSLGMPKAAQDNLRTPKSQSLGMPRKASPLSSTSVGNFTWSYIFIYHMHYRNPVLCRLPWWTAKAGTADGKALCRLQRTANSDGKDRVGKQVLCRRLFMADGKEPFAYSG